ncbi:hypothetical protein PR048_026620 [Dryococelus australis]|uniref:Uncharacterized protein n=1 Tax=Dryococelus australis TaxID=614101 RepID=A0ABQ9GLU4_9NEOP|nr:hypothetical protein PR048_026620 [Dryococelus australis]
MAVQDGDILTTKIAVQYGGVLATNMLAYWLVTWSNPRWWTHDQNDRVGSPESNMAAARYLRIFSGYSPLPSPFWGRGGVVVRLFATHLGEPDCIPVSITPEFSHVGMGPDDATGRRVFSGISSFPCTFIPALLHPHLTSPSLTRKTSMLRAAHISPLSISFPLNAQGEARRAVSARFVFFTCSCSHTEPTQILMAFPPPLPLLPYFHSPRLHRDYKDAATARGEGGAVLESKLSAAGTGRQVLAGTSAAQERIFTGAVRSFVDAFRSEVFANRNAVTPGIATTYCSNHRTRPLAKSPSTSQRSEIWTPKRSTDIGRARRLSTSDQQPGKITTWACPTAVNDQLGTASGVKNNVGAVHNTAVEGKGLRMSCPQGTSLGNEPRNAQPRPLHWLGMTPVRLPASVLPPSSWALQSPWHYGDEPTGSRVYHFRPQTGSISQQSLMSSTFKLGSPKSVALRRRTDRQSCLPFSSANWEHFSTVFDEQHLQAGLSKVRGTTETNRPAVVSTIFVRKLGAFLNSLPSIILYVTYASAGLPCLITPSEIEPGHECDCSNTLRKAVAENSSSGHYLLATTKYFVGSNSIRVVQIISFSGKTTSVSFFACALAYWKKSPSGLYVERIACLSLSSEVGNAKRSSIKQRLVLTVLRPLISLRDGPLDSSTTRPVSSSSRVVILFYVLRRREERTHLPNTTRRWERRREGVGEDGGGCFIQSGSWELSRDTALRAAVQRKLASEKLEVTVYVLNKEVETKWRFLCCGLTYSLIRRMTLRSVPMSDWLLRTAQQFLLADQ